MYSTFFLTDLFLRCSSRSFATRFSRRFDGRQVSRSTLQYLISIRNPLARRHNSFMLSGAGKSTLLNALASRCPRKTADKRFLI